MINVIKWYRRYAFSSAQFLVWLPVSPPCTSNGQPSSKLPNPLTMDIHHSGHDPTCFSALKYPTRNGFGRIRFRRDFSTTSVRSRR